MSKGIAVERKTLKDVMVFNNLNVACFDANGEQISDLQRSLLSLWAEHAELLGYNVEGLVVKTQTGDWRLYKTEYGWNYTFG